MLELDCLRDIHLYALISTCPVCLWSAALALNYLDHMAHVVGLQGILVGEAGEVAEVYAIAYFNQNRLLAHPLCI